MTDTADFAALCAAIDEGDDGQLPILADWLNDAGDPRAGGAAEVLSRLAAHPPGQITSDWVGARRTACRRCGHYGATHLISVAGDDGHWWEEAVCILCGRMEPTRSAAFLALAEALVAITPEN